METVEENMKIMIFYLLSEEIQRINIIRDETTIKDINNIIEYKMKYIHYKMSSEDFDINRIKLLNSNSYAWDIIQENKSIVRVNIIVFDKYLHISEIDISKIIFNPTIQEYGQAIYVNYEYRRLTFILSPIYIYMEKGVDLFIMTILETFIMPILEIIEIKNY